MRRLLAFATAAASAQKDLLLIRIFRLECQARLSVFLRHSLLALGAGSLSTPCFRCMAACALAFQWLGDPLRRVLVEDGADVERKGERSSTPRPSSSRRFRPPAASARKITAELHLI